MKTLRERRLLEEIKNCKVIYSQGVWMQMTSVFCETASNKKPDFDAATSNLDQTHSREEIK